MESLKLALIQTDLFWERPQENRDNIENQLNNINEKVDIIILPEMFSSGFTMNPKVVSEKMDGETVQWMKQKAVTTNAAICGSLVIEDSDKFYNRFLFVKPDGEIECYDKRHTFTLAGEHEVYESGLEKIIIDYKGWKICPLICYDLRFPVWARNVEDYDLLLYVANWPTPRINAWDALLKARAIENMSYCIGVNRIGEDENGHEYSGHSAVYDVLGKPINFSEKKEVIITEIFKREIELYRNKLKFLQDRDTFNLK
ncbi:amidohydrolase [Flavobacteriaceae bacterium R38]|nr:amidohydrolase [Flavobacteriaceae bacterium R38]